MKYIYILIIAFLVSAYSYANPVWKRKVINYERGQYEAGPQNWMIDQSENGWIYCANNNGLLEFDGVNWSLYPIRNRILRSLKIVNNKIFVGGSSEFGYFAPNEMGFLEYKSLSEKITGWTGEVWKILLNDNIIYFISDMHIHMYKDGLGIRTIAIDKKIDCSGIVGGKLYIGTTEGIFFLNKENKMEFLSTSSSLLSHKLVSILPYENRLLVTTAQFGLYLLDNNSIQRVHSIADDFISANQMFSTSILGSVVALGSVQSGTLLFDLKNPRFKEIYNLDNGLKNNTILSSFFDKDNNLWLGLDKGIGLIDLNTPVSHLYATVSPIGTGYCSALYRNEFYLGTNQGLYKSEPDGTCRLIKGSEGQIWSMLEYDNSLFCSGDNGIMVIDATGTYKINIPGIWETHPIAPDKDKLIAGSYFGLDIIEKKNGRWVPSHRVENFNNSSRGFIEDDENPHSFWLVNDKQKVEKITFDSVFYGITNRKEYTLGNSRTSENLFFRKVDNNLIICGLDGIYQYSRITDSFDKYTQLESMLEGPRYYEFLFVDKLKNIWFVTDSKLKFRKYSPNGYNASIYNWGLSNELIINHENVYLPDPKSAIISVDNAFIKIDLTKDIHKLKNIKTYIKSLSSSRNDSIISTGQATSLVSIPYSLNSIKINFAATDFTQTSDILYVYRLRGVDDEWSLPSSIASKEYTNLSEGKYVFEVKAFVNGNTDPTNTASVSFMIFPPWYRSSLAYILYFLIIIIFLFVLYKKTISKQKKIIYQKGEELIAQTKRYEEETKLKDQEIYELQNENLKTELRYKTQELSGYMLNVIRKNEILEDVKKNALSISKSIDEEKEVNIIKQKVVRLISQINSNIEHDTDFEVFKSNFDLVHQDFFRLLDERFPGLSRNDKILCAYLYMNLSTKEIAPLLNISTRGVEVNRYRLRKKMNLDRDINLSEYLQNLK
ncbi:triple tyrosine motif-containing protein [uncultured Dysgonomonas sp.]|uniref:Two component regulator three Y domain-containing protein n=2 Tax=Dysgonomonas TaxID=156973 RepID=A0A212JFJ1_9BACT|nr:triple tyrosine motif-containing protein [uncultured Dysgonomonas sp.]SBV98025.1 conserved exported hypothetical protein [uncultured Dysgonomonas sp.]